MGGKEGFREGDNDGKIVGICAQIKGEATLLRMILKISNRSFEDDTFNPNVHYPTLIVH